MIDRHHLLECILWPNCDGTFRKIINRAERLKELGIYDDYKLTIQIDHSAHQTMHRDFEKGTEYEMVGENNPMYGKGYLIEGTKNSMYGRSGDKNPMYGRGYLRTSDKNPNWKGNKAGPSGMYKRAKKLYKSGKMTEEEFQPFRETLNEYKRERKRAQRLLNSLPID